MFIKKSILSLKNHLSWMFLLVAASSLLHQQGRTASSFRVISTRNTISRGLLLSSKSVAGATTTSTYVRKGSFLLPRSSSISFGRASLWKNVPRAGDSTVTAMSTTATVDEGATATATAAVPPLEETSEAFKNVLEKLTTISELKQCQSILSYDQMVFMPQTSEAGQDRGKQLSALAGILHGLTTDAELLKLMEQAQQDVSSDSHKDETRLLELELKSYKENACISKELASKEASLSSTARMAWTKARESSDFSKFEKELEECFEAAKEIADAKRVGLGNEHLSTYSQMLDQFETGMSKDRIDEVFEPVVEALKPLIQRVVASPHQPNTECLDVKDIATDKQKEVATTLVKAIGYDMTKGRFDEAAHPFTSGSGKHDVRITTRYNKWSEGVLASIHEAGHAIYEQNSGSGSDKYKSLSINSYLSMGTHESQSLFWERHIGKSREFWKFATPILKEGYGEVFDKFTADDLYCAVNRVQPSLIRVEADELTYPLHVILRYNIERDIVEGKLQVKDIPQQWNTMMKDYLCVDVLDDKDGCLQDVHWSVMAIGYFPTYLIGSLTAAQLAHYCQLDIPNMWELVEKGEFTPLKEWLTNKIHQHGKRPTSLDDLLESQLGEKLNPQYFIDYVTKKYTDLYQLS